MTQNLRNIMDERDVKYEQRFRLMEDEADDARVDLKDSLATSGTAIDKALASLDKRFDAINEFNVRMTNQAMLSAGAVVATLLTIPK